MFTSTVSSCDYYLICWLLGLPPNIPSFYWQSPHIYKGPFSIIWHNSVSFRHSLLTDYWQIHHWSDTVHHVSDISHFWSDCSLLIGEHSLFFVQISRHRREGILKWVAWSPGGLDRVSWWVEWDRRWWERGWGRKRAWRKVQGPRSRRGPSIDIEKKVENITNVAGIVLQIQVDINFKGNEDDCQTDADNKWYGHK